MRTARRTRATKNWHLIRTIERGVEFSSCGLKMGAEHFRVNRERFEALPKGARCVSCADALAAYKAKLLADVAEIERRDRAAEHIATGRK